MTELDKEIENMNQYKLERSEIKKQMERLVKKEDALKKEIEKNEY